MGPHQVHPQEAHHSLRPKFIYFTFLNFRYTVTQTQKAQRQNILLRALLFSIESVFTIYF